MPIELSPDPWKSSHKATCMVRMRHERSLRKCGFPGPQIRSADRIVGELFEGFYELASLPELGHRRTGPTSSDST